MFLVRRRRRLGWCVWCAALAAADAALALAFVLAEPRPAMVVANFPPRSDRDNDTARTTTGHGH